MANNSRINIKLVHVTLAELIYFVFYLLYIIMLCMWCLEYWNNMPNSEYEYAVFPWIIISLFINIIGFICIKKVSYIDMTLWFVMLSYMFMFGHVFLKVFDWETTLNWNPGIYFSDIEKYHAALYGVLSISFIMVGYLLTSKSNIGGKTNINNLPNKYMSVLGWLFFGIGFICNIINSIIVIGTTYVMGSYTAYADAAASTSFLNTFSYLMIPGVIYILCSRTLSNLSASIFIVIVIMYLTITMVLSGSRKTQLFAILTIILCFNWTRKNRKLGITKLLLIGFFAMIFLNLIYVIRENRTDLSSIVPKYIESFINFEYVQQIFSETLAESGLTMYSVVAVIKCVPSVFSFEKGMTFIRIIPSFLPIGWLAGDFFNKGYSTYVINRYTGIPVGATIIGDFYWNFNIIGGMICCLILGIIFSKLSNNLENGTDYEAVYFSVFYILLIGIRAGMMELYRPLVIVTFVPFLIKVLISRKVRNNKNLA